jgi:uncharacterized membrane protein
VVHFVVALGMVGVFLRLVSFTGRAAWTSPAATAALIVAALASVLAVSSGDAAHGPAERIPGAREVVHEHEERGELARNLFLVVAALELGALALRRREAARRLLLIGSGVAGIAAGVALYRAAEEGGELVYDYAGGIGFRSGDTTDVQRLLVAGLFHQARIASAQGRPDEAARLIEELARQRPDDPAVALLGAQSRLRDRQDPVGALTALAALRLPDGNPRLAIQRDVLTAEALAATGARDSARVMLEALVAAHPESRMAREALDKLR